MKHPHSAAAASPGARSAVLTKAVLRAADLLGLTQRDLGAILGLSDATVSRLRAGTSALDPAGKDGELALLFLRVFRSLDTLLGGREEAVRAWMRAENHHLGGVPLSRIHTIEGMVHVAEYLDGMRGQL